MNDSQPASWMDSLHAFPKLAEGIGQFMASFASLERFLWELYAIILGQPVGDMAIALLGHIDSFFNQADGHGKLSPLFCSCVRSA